MTTQRRWRGERFIKRFFVAGIIFLVIGSFTISATTKPQEAPQPHFTYMVGENTHPMLKIHYRADRREILADNQMVVSNLKIHYRANRSPTKGHDLGWSADEEYIAARMAMAEAEGEDTKGKALVILVIYNRTKSGKFPDTVEDVISQKNAFTSYHNGRYKAVEPDTDCWAAMDLIQETGWDGSQGRYTLSGLQRMGEAHGTAETSNGFSRMETIPSTQKRKRR